VGKARRLAQRVRLRREPDEPALAVKSPGGGAPGATASGGDADPHEPAIEPGPDDAAARIDAARARLRATIEPPADPDI
jgi:hypothetical protein